MVVNCLNPFFQVDRKSGRILSPDDFKYLARRCVFLSLNLSIPNLFVEINSALLEPVVFTKRGFILSCKFVGEVLVCSVQMKNTENCCSHGNV